MISEAEALRRADVQRDRFPKARITVAQAKQMVLAMAQTQVGYNPKTSTFSLYGKARNWRTRVTSDSQGYWCARGISWVFDQCFGRAATIAGIGNQGWGFPGWAATWLWLAWLRNGRHVGLENARPGDISMQSWGRTTNATDHVEMVTSTWNGSTYGCVGFNTSAQGSGGSQTTGAGVWNVRRNRHALVGIYRPDWDALVAVYNAQFADPAPAPPAPAPAPVAPRPDQTVRAVQTLLAELGYDPGDVDGLTGPRTTSAVRAYQADFALTITGTPNTTTRKSLEDTMTKLNDLEKKIDRVLAVQAQDGRYIRSIPTRVWREDIPFIKGTSLHDLFGDKFRAGALAGYAAASHLETPRRLNALATRITAIFGKKVEALAETRPEPNAVPAAARED